ncbi:MAG: hypothetical protein R2795_02930 [Saprospiraceae bacterium]
MERGRAQDQWLLEYVSGKDESDIRAEDVFRCGRSLIQETDVIPLLSMLFGATFTESFSFLVFLATFSFFCLCSMTTGQGYFTVQVKMPVSYLILLP